MNRCNLIKLLQCGRHTCTPLGLLLRNTHGRAIEVTWKKPESGWTKLNFDGSYREKTGMSSIGGAFRNHKAELILAYAESIEKKSSTIAELSALRRGLEFVLENGWRNVWLEGDPKSLVEIILERRRVKSEEIQKLVSDINLIIPELNNCYLSHIYREGNRVADMLARMGHETKYPRVWRNDPPQKLLPILHDDAQGKVFSRRI